jgi:hypothetical protein
LFLSSGCRIPFTIFCSGRLVVMYYFSFCLSWKIFIPPSIFNDIFAAYSILGLKCSSVLETLHSMPLLLLSFLLRNFCILMGLPLYVIWFFSLIVFSILSLFCVLIALTIICCEEVLFW